MNWITGSPQRRCVCAPQGVLRHAGAASGAGGRRCGRRSTRERLKATLRRERGGAVAARAAPHAGRTARPSSIRRSARSRAGAAPGAWSAWYAAATPEQRRDMLAADERAVRARCRRRSGGAGAVRRRRRARPTRRRPRCRTARATVSPRRACCSASALFPRACASWWTCAPSCCRTSRATSACWRWTSRWSTCSPPGSTWAFWSCAASAGIRRPR